jgi:hypothetical protein
MQRYVKFPFFYFFVAASIGLLLRWHFVEPIGWLKFPFWLHAHSHLMFLGWIFNLILLALTGEFVAPGQRGKYHKLFLAIQGVLLIMLVAFPLQGYGVVSIAVSTLHTILVCIFIVWFFRDTKDNSHLLPVKLSRIALLFFILSFLGPLSLGPLMMNNLAQSQWYYFAVYFYLHFQYNGVFTFAVFSLFFQWLQREGVDYSKRQASLFSYWMLIACSPAYFLSTLWASPGMFFSATGAIAAGMQGIALGFLITVLRSVPRIVFSQLPFIVKAFLLTAFTAFFVKLLLQALSAFPAVALLAYNVRNYIMAYLHLVLLGMITTFLLAWCIAKQWLSLSSPAGILFLIGFAGTEWILISKPFHISPVINTPVLIYFFSLLIAVAIGFYFLRAVFGQPSG